MTELQNRAKRFAIGIVVFAAVLASGALFVKTPMTYYLTAGGLLVVVVINSIALTTFVSELVKTAREREGSAQKARSELMSTVRQQKEISERFEKIQFLTDLLKTISGSNDLGSVLDNTLDQTMRFFGCRSGFVMLVDEESRELYVERAKAVDGQPINTGRLPIGEGIVGTVAATGVPRLIGSAKKLPGRYQSLASSQAALMCAPLKIEKKVIGVLTIEERDNEENFSESDLEFLTLIAAETGIAVEKARLYERMEQMSVTDGLTGVANRRYLDARLHDELLRARRYHLPLAVTLLDIDNFKSFNDTYGHAVGDEVLKALAKTLAANVRDTDLVARYGGEEFAIVSPDCAAEQAGGTAERLRMVVERLEVRDSEEHPQLKITISLGVASFPADASEEQELLKAADEALYYSKEHGRNQVTLKRNMEE